jgi:hypothetical protein
MTLTSERKDSIPVTKGTYASGDQSFKERAACEHFTQHDISCHPRFSAGGNVLVRHTLADLGAILDTRAVYIHLPESEDRVVEGDEQAIHDGALAAMSGGSESNSHRAPGGGGL